MANLRTLLVVAGLAIAFVSVCCNGGGRPRALFLDECVVGSAGWCGRNRFGSLLPRQASRRYPFLRGSCLGLGVAVAAAAVAWAWFRLPVLGLIAFLVVYHLIGTALEFRRRGFEARHQEALLEAVRHGTCGHVAVRATRPRCLNRSPTAVRSRFGHSSRKSSWLEAADLAGEDVRPRSWRGSAIVWPTRSSTTSCLR